MLYSEYGPFSNSCLFSNNIKTIKCILWKRLKAPKENK